MFWRTWQSVDAAAWVTAFSTAVERLVVNLTDPDARHGDARSTRAHPHPFLTDDAVRKALSMAIDRKLLVEIGYGACGTGHLQCRPRS